MSDKIQQRTTLANGVVHDRSLLFDNERAEDLVEKNATNAGRIAFTGDSMGVRGDTLPSVPEMIYSDGTKVRAMSDGFPVAPTFLFDFAGTKTLADDLDFRRNSEETYFDADGILRTAAPFEPAFAHDPVTGESLGLQFDNRSENEVLWSEDFSNAVWSVPGSVATNVAVAVDANQTADKITQTGGAGTDFARQSVTVIPPLVPLLTSPNRVFSVWMKLTGANEGDGTVEMDINSDDAGPSESSSQTVTLTGAWQRFDLLHLFIVTDWPTYSVGVSATATGPTEILIWGAQGQDEVLGTYQPTQSTFSEKRSDLLRFDAYAPLFNVNKGTWFAQLSIVTVLDRSITIFKADGGLPGSGNPDDNRTETFLTSDGGILSITDSTLPPELSGRSFSAGIPERQTFGYAFTYELNSVTGFTEGTAAPTDTTATLPVVGPMTRLRVLAYGGILAKLAYYDEVVSFDRAVALSENP